ncbi:MAG: hypothetical protein IJ506_06500 [Clostridia bacterium]|nr:hypothetical protein [Clostridia bacterium]
MKKNEKLKGLFSFAFLSASCLAMALAVNSSNEISASASGTETPTATVATAEQFKLNSGAAVWIGDDNYGGIRFSADVKESYINGLENVKSIQYWTIVAPAKNVTDVSELTVENREAKDAVIVNATETTNFTTDEDETFTYTAKVKYNFADTTVWTEDKQQALIDLPLVARPCLAITYENDSYEYVYANLEGTESKKMRNIAEEELVDEVAATTPNYDEAQLNTLLSYVKSEDTNAYHDSVDGTTLAFIDNTANVGYSVYTKTVEEDVAKFTQITTFSEGETATLSENIFAGAEVGATTELYLCNGTDFVKTSVKEVTQIIYDAEDLKVFNLTATDQQIVGTYVLANDIVDTATTYNTGYWAKSFFKGVFDGLGHSLTFKTNLGLFGVINAGAVIENVNFKNCTIVTEETYQTSLLGYTLATAPISLKNLSVSLSDATYTTFATQNKDRRILVYDASSAYNSIVCENVMIKFDYSKLPTADTATKTIYAVSKLGKGTSNFNVVAVNFDSTKTYARGFDLIENKLEVATTSTDITKYDSYDALKTYYETEEGKAALATFDTTYWDVTTKGFPILDYSALDWAESLGTGMFSGWLDDTEGFETDTDGDNQVLPFDIDGTVTGVYLKENISSEADLTSENNLYANGKVNITNTSTRAIEYTTILIQTAEGDFYEATLEVYTRIINSKEDLRMFDSDSKGNSSNVTLSGYYALGCDIVDTEQIYNDVGSFNTKWIFQGIFDGMGHSLTFKAGNGLFGVMIKGASTDSTTIKNVNFKDCTITAASDATFASSLLGYTNSAAPTYLTNLSVSLSDATYTNLISAKKNNYILICNESNAKVTCTNVMVKFDYSKLEADTVSDYKIYLVSKISTSTSNTCVVALNYDETKTYARSFEIFGDTTATNGTITKYDSYDDLKTYFATEEGATALATFTTYWDVSLGYPVWKEQN